MKALLRKYFENLLYFYSHIKYRVFIVFILSLLVGVFDVLGLSMFLPLLQTVNSSTGIIETSSMGKLSFVVEGLQKVGFELKMYSVLIFMVIFFILKGIAKYYSTYYRIYTQQLMVKRTRIKMLNTFNVIKFKDFVTEDVGRIQNAMTGEIDKLTRAFNMYFSTFEQVVFIFVYVFFAFLVDFQFALLVTFGGLLTNFIYNHFYKLTKHASKKISFISNKYQGQIIQHVANFKYLRATSAVSSYSEMLKSTILSLEATRMKIGKYGAALQALREPLVVIIIVIVIAIQFKFLGGNLDSILISLLFFYRALSSLTTMQTTWNRFLADSGALHNVKTFQEKLNKSKEQNGKKYYERLQKGISLTNISFVLGSKKIIDKISLDIYKNESIAFVGESGSGKTSLINIITGLYRIDNGEFLVDGIPLNDLNVETYQKRIGYVTQEPVIFNDTIFNNVTFWADYNETNIKKFREVILQASLEKYIEDLPEKEHTVLGNSGINISGGQRQRISIARELYKDIDILILDEATSALDSETEKFIQESIESLKGKLMLIIVAHRLSTIMNVDRIVLLSRGSILDIGSFDNLKEKNLIFKKMTDMQLISAN